MSKKYTTVQGDMWDSIAASQMGSTSYTDALMNANKSMIGYHIFPAGIVLSVPDVPDASVSDLLPPWKKV